VLATVDLNNKLCIHANEIHDKSVDWDLALELEAEESAIAESRPHFPLGPRGFFSQSAR
jgi:hypothetical protein